MVLLEKNWYINFAVYIDQSHSKHLAEKQKHRLELNKILYHEKVMKIIFFASKQTPNSWRLVLKQRFKGTMPKN